MCGGAVNNLRGVLSDDFAKKNLLSGGLLLGTPKNVKAVDGALRKDTLENNRDKGVLPPKKVTVDPEAERAAAAATATTQANARIAFMRKAQRDNSLATGGGNMARGTLGV